MTTGNGAASPLEQQLQAVAAEINDAQAEADAAEHPLDPNVAGENAAHAVHQCLVAAEHIRSMGQEFLAIAQTVKATGDALAADMETRAKLFDGIMQSARSYAKQTNDIFAQERQRLADFKIPGMSQSTAT